MKSLKTIIIAGAVLIVFLIASLVVTHLPEGSLRVSLSFFLFQSFMLLVLLFDVENRCNILVGEDCKVGC